MYTSKTQGNDVSFISFYPIRNENFFFGFSVVGGFLFIYEVRQYGSKTIVQINGQCELIKYLNEKFWHSFAPFSSKKLQFARDQVFTLGKDSYITNRHYGYDIWRVF